MPPLPPSNAVDFGRLALNMGLSIVWAIVASIGFAAAIAIGLKVFSALTPGIDEWEELKKGNTSVSILWAAFTIAVGVVVVGVLLK